MTELYEWAMNASMREFLFGLAAFAFFIAWLVSMGNAE